MSHLHRRIDAEPTIHPFDSTASNLIEPAVLSKVGADANHSPLEAEHSRDDTSPPLQQRMLLQPSEPHPLG